MSRLFDPNVSFPFLTLLISGGHCILALVESEDTFHKLGDSIDMSPGNFVDKIARKLGLFCLNNSSNMSGGALVESYARLAANNTASLPELKKIENTVKLYAKKNRDCNFSYSGFLTAILRLIDKLCRDEATPLLIDGIERTILSQQTIAHICMTVQNVILLQLADRLQRAFSFLSLRGVAVKHVVISGGVASNSYLKKNLIEMCQLYEVDASFPPPAYCTDNGVMIAWNGIEKLNNKSEHIVHPNDQSQLFFDSMKPEGRAHLGRDMTYQVKLLNIKN